ncbi:hypothetical protein [Streptomyces sp. NPDC007083]|uniref:hypothetical protein n=1 Tax=Streptomyces sp. NPDC007083 TaxID=3156913 RepID=UPI0033D645FD
MATGEDTTRSCTCRDAEAAANDAIRRFVHGRVMWTPEALTELDRLRRAWREATNRDMTTAS